MGWNLAYFVLGVVATLAVLLMGHMLTWITDSGTVVPREMLQRAQERANRRKELIREMFCIPAVRVSLTMVQQSRVRRELNENDDEEK